MKVSIIAAIAENMVIGKNNDLAWHLPDDMAFFKEKTAGRTVLMGRKNYESIPHKYRPLPGRPNIVISRTPHYEAPGCRVVNSLEAGLEAAKREKENHAFVIGGGEIYRLALQKDLVDEMYITHVHHDVEGDTYFPPFGKEMWIAKTLSEHAADSRHTYPFTIVHYKRRTAQ